MLDLHCHILPGIDDGAQNLEEALVMAEKAVQQGITHILCTPHQNQRFCNPKEKVLAQVAQLQKELDKRKIPLTLFEGQEVRLHQDLITEIKKDQILFADVKDTYLLVEFPSAKIPSYAESLLYQLCKEGKVPIIVHPERNRGFQKEPNELLNFLNMGCLAQLTAPSIVGKFGKYTQELSHQLIDHDYVQLIASDAHNLHKRDFYLKEAYDYVRTHFGEEKIYYMNQVCKDIINGDQVTINRYDVII